MRSGTICAEVRLFNTGSSVLPCVLGRSKSLKKVVSAEGIEPSTYSLRVLVERRINNLATFEGVRPLVFMRVSRLPSQIQTVD